jgi:outer membrane protein, heavy metal efflux system
VCRAGRNCTTAQLQDAIRNQIDNLYTVYVDVISAGLTVKFSETYAEGLSRLLRLNEVLLEKGVIKQADVLAIRANLEKAHLQIQESKQAKIKANQARALILNMPLDNIESLDVRDSVGLLDPLPLPKDVLIAKALAARPDLAAIKLGVLRAQADVKLARANSYPDVYLLSQPYTFQNNTYLGVPSAYSWTLGVTATMPVFKSEPGEHHADEDQRDADGAPTVIRSRGRWARDRSSSSLGDSSTSPRITRSTRTTNKGSSDWRTNRWTREVSRERRPCPPD